MRKCARVGMLMLSLALMLPMTASAAAGTMDSHWYIAPFVGNTQFDGEYGKLAMRKPGFEAEDGLNYGGRLGFLSSSGFGIEVAGGYTTSEVSQTTPALNSDLTFYHVTGNLIYSPSFGNWGGPFVSTGFGLANNTLKDATPAVSFADGSDKLDQGMFDVAGGWQFPLGAAMAIRLEARNLLWIPKEDVASAKFNDVIYGGALAFNFGGKPKDTDVDGVPDKSDKCPDTPVGALVNAEGCPTDADKDGVFDGLDKCPQTPRGASVNPEGCPSDTDKDGVFDGIDKCADTPVGATVDAAGCPSDADNDGVVDGVDQCANTISGARVDERGCPADTDADGVPDGVDKCEATPAGARVDKDGCPIEISERETQFLDTGLIRLTDITFATGKSVIDEKSYGEIDVIGRLLSNWPQLKIEIGGHTDASGSAAANQKLSEARAAAVEQYLLKQFPTMKDDQFTVKGYGESKPLVPNTTKANMAKNRRVEFKVLNTDVLKKEVENRRLLQK